MAQNPELPDGAKHPSVTFITRKWPPAMGGMETYCKRLTEEMAKTHALDIIALPGKANGDAPAALSLVWFGLTTAIRILFMKPASIIHIGDVASWPLGWVASLRYSKSKIVLSAHGSDLNYATGNGLLPRIYARYIGLATKLLPKVKVIANSNWIADLAREQGFSDVVTVPLATDIKAEQMPGQHNDCLFFAGRIMPSKGLSFIVKEVMPLLSIPLKIRVAGTVWDEQEGSVLSDPSVEYLGVLDQKGLIEEYGKALCVVVPSLGKEGFGLVAAEAAACGGVVLASNHSGLKEVVTEDIGFVADPKNPAEWAAVIKKMRGWLPEDRSEFLQKSMAITRARYGWNRVAKDTLSAYGTHFGDLC